MIINVSPSNIEEAAEIYSISWIESHKDVCSERFLKEHTPSYMSREIYRANPEMVRYETFPSAGHGLSYMVDNKRYRELVDEFLSSGVRLTLN